MQVVKHIVKRAADTKVLRFRHCARFLPCTHICKPEMEDISKTAAAAVASALDCCTLLCPSVNLPIPQLYILEHRLGLPILIFWDNGWL